MTSRNASSSDSGSTIGVYRSKISRTSRLTCGVQLVIAGQEHGVRTSPPGDARRHRRVHAVATGLVRRGRHDAAGARAADDDRLTDEFGAPTQFDRHEEGVHVGVQDRVRRPVDRSRVGADVTATSLADTIRGMIQPIDDERALSALPSVGVRVAAFAAILVSGLAGGLIGYSLIDLQCDGDCGLAKGIGLLVGALTAAIGMAVVAVLVMRAIGEWREIEDRTNAGHAPR